MREPIPIQQWLPAGPLRDMGEKYVSGLPDVAQNPIGPESLMHQSDHSWTEYLVAYSLLYPWVGWPWGPTTFFAAAGNTTTAFSAPNAAP